MKCAIILHGGAGSGVTSPAVETLLKKTAKYCYTDLKAGQPALEIAIRAIIDLEDSGQLNAGIGSYPTDEDTIEMDAGVMNGLDETFGGVCALEDTRNAIIAANHVRNSSYSMLAGEGARVFLTNCGQDWEHIPVKAKPVFEQSFGTVGAAVTDRQGNTAAAVSTGGQNGKPRGRVGDSAVVGAGYYANSLGSAVATGNGDKMLKYNICKSAVMALQEYTPQESADLAIKLLDTDLEEFGGIIITSAAGLLGSAFNTNVMQTAECRSKTNV